MAEFNNLENFKKSVINSVGILFLVKLILLPISGLVNIILARLLEPIHFGIYGILSVIIYTTYDICDLGLVAFAVQTKDELNLNEYRTVFTLKLILSIIGFIILWLISTFLINLFHLSKEAQIAMKLLSLVILIEPISSISRVILQRKLLYKKIAFLDTINLLSFYLVVIILAYYHFEVWSFILAGLISVIITNILYIIISPWNFGLNLNTEVAKRALKFGSFFQLSNIIKMVREYTTAILGGIIFGPKAVGYLSWADNITSKIATTFTQEVNRVTFPAISRIQTDKKAVSLFFSKTVYYLLLLTSPLIFMLFALSYETIIIIFKPKWLPALPALIAFGFVVLAGHFIYIGENLLKGLGQVKKASLITGLWTITLWLIIPFTKKWLGYNSIAFAWMISSFLSTILIINTVNKYHPLDLKPILYILFSSAFSAFLISLLKNIITINIYTLIILYILGILGYILILFIIKHTQIYGELKNLLKLLLSSYRDI